jgi:MFS family permease
MFETSNVGEQPRHGFLSQVLLGLVRVVIGLFAGALLGGLYGEIAVHFTPWDNEGGQAYNFISCVFLGAAIGTIIGCVMAVRKALSAKRLENIDQNETTKGEPQ